MKAWLVLVALAACGPGLAPVDSHTRIRATLEAASGNAAAIRKLLRGSVTNAGLWFLDPACMAQFPAAAELHEDRLDAFARCLAGLHFHVSNRVDPLPDVEVLTYAPGLEIEALVMPDDDGPHLEWIGYLSRRDRVNGLPSVAPEVLAALRVTPERDPPIDTSRLQPCEFAWIDLCIDATGAVTHAHVREASSTRAAHAFGDAAAHWHFQPYTIAGHALPVCSLIQLPAKEHARGARQDLPYPRPPELESDQPELVLPPEALHRIAGNIQLQPDPDTQKAMAHLGVSRISGAVMFCIDTRGNIANDAILSTSGSTAYDAILLAGVKQWKYQPYVEDGKPQAVCSAATFIYSQH